MEVNRRRTQQERSAAMRAALVASARELFAAEGYAAVGTEAIVRAAEVTRGALYHHFADKEELFLAVFEDVEREVLGRIVASMPVVGPDAGTAATLAALDAGVATWLDACADPGTQRILLVDGPAVLGWTRWRELGMGYAGGLIEAVVAQAVTTGPLGGLPARPVTHVVIGALEEAALYVAGHDDPAAARAEMAAVLSRTFAALFGYPTA
jgi:AcrR family transcriptional regulator